MVGNHNSGRKKSTDSEFYRMGKKTFYIKQEKKKNGKWVDDPVRCPNTGLLGNYVSRKQPRCQQCGAWRNEITRLRYEG